MVALHTAALLALAGGQAWGQPGTLRRLPGLLPDAGVGASRIAATAPLPSATASGDASRTDRYDGLLLQYAERYKLNPRLLKAIIAAESDFVTRATSPKGAYGLMQIMPSTARDMGIEPSDLARPEQNIRAGAAYLSHLFGRACRRLRLPSRGGYARAPAWLTERVLAAYNGGPRLLAQGDVHGRPGEYAHKVLSYFHAPVTALRIHEPPRREAPFIPPHIRPR